MSRFLFPPALPPSLPVIGSPQRFPVHRIYCVGRNFAEHAREMGAETPREAPVFFCKPADALLVGGGDMAYPLATEDLHHEVELVAALGTGSNAPVDRDTAAGMVFGYGIGIDLTRRDRQAEAKAARLPWDVAKGFDRSAPISALTPAEHWQPGNQAIWFDVNGERRQSGHLDDMIHDVPAAIAALSTLFELRAGDLLFMGTPSGVGPLRAGDRWQAGIDGLPALQGRVLGR
ncbi:MAG: fumarylacetoacetate hydrolase family protein [Lysobacteraceae bacterium]